VAKTSNKHLAIQALCGVAVACLAAPGYAQNQAAGQAQAQRRGEAASSDTRSPTDTSDAAAQAGPAAGDQMAVDEIVVTATRRRQRLQDVPLNVTAVTSADLAKNNVVRLEEVAKLAPGLNLQQGSNGTEISLRGVNSAVTSAGPPAVDIYLDESPLIQSIAFRSLYDVGQIEVLRGPQGTLRGDTAPSGALTIATRRPELDQLGGSLSLIGSRRDRWQQNAQGALNVPIVNDVLGLRVAGSYDKNDYGGAHNPTTSAASKDRSASVRASLLFRPTSNFEIFGMYQFLGEDTYSLAQVEGQGVGYNGPPITAKQNLAVQEATSHQRFDAHIGSLVAKLDLDGASLNYVGGYRNSKTVTGVGDFEVDPGNAILNFGRASVGQARSSVIQWSHELRLDSSGNNRFWDYTVGVYRSSGGSSTRAQNPLIPYPGALGDPATVSGPPSGPAVGRYIGLLNLNIYGGDSSIFGDGGNRSIFASSTFNFKTGTHLRVGARRIWLKTDNNFVLGLDPAYIAIPLGFPTQGACDGIPGFVASIYPTSCDLLLPASTLNDQHSKRDLKAWVYDVNLRQEFSRDLMAYVSFGRNWRAPGVTQGDVPAQYFLAQPEVSKNYEVGLKGAFFERRVRLSAAAFQQDFKNYNASATLIPYRNTSTSVTDAFAINYNGNARVRGVEADLSGSITSRWTARAGVSYTESQFKDAISPCRDSNFDGIPDGGSPTAADFNARGISIATCRTNGPVNGLPKLTYNLQSEYIVPVDGGEVYLRGLFNWRGRGRIVSSSVPVPSYGVLDLFSGIRLDGYEIGVFSKNVFDVRRVFDRTGNLTIPTILPDGVNASTGYQQLYSTPGREVGVTVRVSFGGG
jgi:iron complex outermembrane receptor protein